MRKPDGKQASSGLGSGTLDSGLGVDPLRDVGPHALPQWTSRSTPFMAIHLNRRLPRGTICARSLPPIRFRDLLPGPCPSAPQVPVVRVARYPDVLCGPAARVARIQQRPPRRRDVDGTDGCPSASAAPGNPCRVMSWCADVHRHVEMTVRPCVSPVSNAVTAAATSTAASSRHTLRSGGQTPPAFGVLGVGS